MRPGAVVQLAEFSLHPLQRQVKQKADQHLQSQYSRHRQGEITPAVPVLETRARCLHHTLSLKGAGTTAQGMKRRQKPGTEEKGCEAAFHPGQGRFTNELTLAVWLPLPARQSERQHSPSPTSTQRAAAGGGRVRFPQGTWSLLGRPCSRGWSYPLSYCQHSLDSVV